MPSISSRQRSAGARDLRVVAIGGGTGLSTLLKGLKRYVDSPPAAVENSFRIAELCAVVTVSDDGGSSGRLRKEFNMLPPGDVRNCIVALSEDEALLARIKRELENYLQIPCLPFRVIEARAGYKANYFATTVVGVWNGIAEPDEESGNKKLEVGFPAAGELTVPDIGKLPYQVVVWRDTLNPDHLTTGLYFLQNGQVHGSFPSDFVSRTLGFDYIKDHVLIAVDCTSMDRGVSEDLFMTSRDRLRKNEEYATIRSALASELKEHPGLKTVNAEWRERRRAVRSN